MPISIPRFQLSAVLVDEHGYPTQTFHIWWDRVAATLEEAFNNIESQVADIAAAQAAAAAAQATATTALNNAATALTNATTALTNATNALTAANNAQTTATNANTTATAAQSTANTAQTTAQNVKRDDGIASSWVSPGTILSAQDAGSNCTIIVASHVRKYNDQTNVSVTGASITGLSYSTTYYIYYDDTARAGGAVTFQATTNANNALPGATAGRHFCGSVVTPASGGSTTSGTVDPPSGGGGVKGGQIP